MSYVKEASSDFGYTTRKLPAIYILPGNCFVSGQYIGQFRLPASNQSEVFCHFADYPEASSYLGCVTMGPVVLTPTQAWPLSLDNVMGTQTAACNSIRDD